MSIEIRIISNQDDLTWAVNDIKQALIELTKQECVISGDPCYGALDREQCANCDDGASSGGDNKTGDESPAVTITRDKLRKALLEAHAEAAIDMTKMIIFGQKPSEQAVMAGIERIADKYFAN